MKFTLALFAGLAIIGLGTAHQFPDFGKGDLHEDIQDILDCIPVENMTEIIQDYIENDPEVQQIVKYMLSDEFMEKMRRDVEKVETFPECRNILNYLLKKGIESYYLINELNKLLGIKEIEPPSSPASSVLRTGGVRGLLDDLEKCNNYSIYIRVFTHKLKLSPAFNDFLNELRSENFQQFVNKIYTVEVYQIILNGLKKYGVNTQVVSDIGYIILNITTPNDPDFLVKPTMENELLHFGNLFQEKYYFQ